MELQPKVTTEWSRCNAVWFSSWPSRPLHEVILDVSEASVDVFSKVSEGSVAKSERCVT